MRLNSIGEMSMTFEFDADKYIKASSHQRQWGNKLIQQLNLKGHERILDLGCGDGELTAHLAELVPDGSVIGIDASKNMITSAQNNHKAENIEFQLMDINDMDFHEEFDVIFSNAALHWIKDHNELLANARKSLRKEGVLLFNFAADGNCTNFLKVIKRAIVEKKYQSYFRDFDWPWYMPTENEYRKILNLANFSETSVFTENADRYFSNSEEMIKWLDQPSLVPFLKFVEIHDKRAFRDYVIEHMIIETSQHDGRCFETFRRINVFAKK